MPPRWRNQRHPTADATPTAAAASSLVTPVAMTRQNARSTSRRCAGAPGDFIADRPVNSFIHPAGLPINTPKIRVLQRPVESALAATVGVKDHTRGCAAASTDRSVESVGDEPGAYVVGESP